MPIDDAETSSRGTTLYRLDDFLSVPRSPLPAPPRLPDPPSRREEDGLSLPLASEEHCPLIPTTATFDRERQQLPSPARRRWFWAFKRVVLLRRQERYPRTLPFPRIPLGVDAPTPPQPKTRWPRLRFDPATSAQLFAICRREGISPSASSTFEYSYNPRADSRSLLSPARHASLRHDFDGTGPHPRCRTSL